ncbi:MAG: MFS transporter [Vibrio sp.]
MEKNVDIAAKSVSSFAPFSSMTFTLLWIATVLSNVGTWMHDVGAGWLMASMSSTPMFVALVQTATTLPMFLFALPAGALADLIDKRRLLIMVQSVLAVTALCLGFIVWQGALTPWLLLTFTFIMGTGAALIAPAWQSVVPMLVSREYLSAAVAANSVGINISRAIGPAIGGIILSFSLAIPFFTNAISFLFVIAVLYWWKPVQPTAQPLPSEHFVSAMRTGIRFAINNIALKSTLYRAAGFFLFASAYWALLPLIAKQLLNGGSDLYGMMMGAVGLGAVSGAIFLPRIRNRIDANQLVAIGSVGTALSMLLLATVSDQIFSLFTCLLAGASWISVLTSLNVSAQISLPEWVRARGLAIFVTVFFGSMTVGSLLWGQVSSVIGLSWTLILAALCLVVFIPITWRFKLYLGEGMDLTPSMHWPTPITSVELEQDQGPVLITVEYLIDQKRSAEFLEMANQLRQQRLRGGAYTWRIYEDTAVPGKILEFFEVESWLEHQRQHHRVTYSDKVLQEQIRTFHLEDLPPKVTHYLSMAQYQNRNNQNRDKS